MKLAEPEQSERRRVAPHRPLTDFYPAPADRRNFIDTLFDRCAPDYNWMSGALSLWTDRRYRVIALRKAGLKPGMKTLDVATGTGLVARAALDLGVARSDVIGLDPSRGMLAENRRATGVRLIQGLGEKLPFAGASFDFITMGYALRHVDDLGELFAEFRRVLRPEGRVLVLEISRPPSRVGFALMSFHMRRVLPLLLRLRGRREESSKLMEYYWTTISECVPPDVILKAMGGVGFYCTRHTFAGGMLNEYAGVRGAS